MSRYFFCNVTTAPQRPYSLNQTHIHCKDVSLTNDSFYCFIPEMPDGGLHVTHLRSRVAWQTGVSHAFRWCLMAYGWLMSILEMPDSLHVTHLHSRDAWLTGASYASWWCLTAYRWLISIPEMPGNLQMTTSIAEMPDRWQLTHMHDRDAWHWQTLTGDLDAAHRHPRDGLQIAVAAW